MSNYITIPLSKNGKHKEKWVAIIDEQDSILAIYNWFVIRGRNTHYVGRKELDNNQQKLIYLHREIVSRILQRELLPHELIDT